MKIHELKSWSSCFWDIQAGVKTADIRLNDRNFMDGDLILFRRFRSPDDPQAEWRGPMGYVKEEPPILAQITHVQGGFRLPQGYVALSIRRVKVVPA